MTRGVAKKATETNVRHAKPITAASARLKRLSRVPLSAKSLTSKGLKENVGTRPAAQPQSSTATQRDRIPQEVLALKHLRECHDDESDLAIEGIGGDNERTAKKAASLLTEVAVHGAGVLSQADLDAVHAQQVSETVTKALRPSTILPTDDGLFESKLQPVVPRCTLFATDLDTLEHEFLEKREDARRSLPSLSALGSVYADKMLLDNDEEIDRMSMVERERLRKAQQRARNTSLSQEPRKGRSFRVFEAASARVVAQVCAGVEKPAAASLNYSKGLVDSADLPAEDNPHFPQGSAERSSGQPASSSEGQSQGQSQAQVQSAVFDSYTTRPHDDRVTVHRGLDFWDDAQHREVIEQRSRMAKEDVALELQREGPLDNARSGSHSTAVRNEHLQYLRAFPINENIQDTFAVISSIQPPDGENITFTASEQVEIPISEARMIARQHGLDLIKITQNYTKKADRPSIAVCVIADHRQDLRASVRLKLAVKGGIQPPRAISSVEVPFRGGTHPFAIRYKAIGVAKHLVKRTPVRINLTEFGTPREGFPIFQTILDEIKKQCAPLKAFHTAGPIQSNYNEIFCMLLPSTAKHPKHKILHPTTEEIETRRDERILELEKEIVHDEYLNITNPKERLTYLTKLQQGTAWAHKDEGLSLQRQREMKVMLGYLPKGNKELYAARGDVDHNHPYRSSHETSAEKWSYPEETNLEQANRAAALLGQRAAMDISEMHNKGETEDNASVVERFYYRIQGPALEVGQMKESMGLKTNRKKRPGLAPGWATLGLKSGPAEPSWGAAK